jgi:uncharacterized protein (PEP-CTERM system associated)
MMNLQNLAGKMKILPLLLGGLGLTNLLQTASAADWIISPAITVEQTYTDNALLTNDNEEQENITRIRPSISLYREGARAKVDINYAPEYRHYWEDTQDDELVHFLRAEGNTELLENHLFLDGWGTADMTSISSTGRNGIDGATGRSDTTEVYTAGLSPYFTAHLGNFSTFEARYTADMVNYTENGLDDNTGQQVDLVLGSGSAFSNQVWELSAMQSVVDYDSLKDDNEVKQVRAELAQQLTSQWALAFAVGHEEYNLAITPDSDGTLWSVGVIYTPNPRTRLALGGGERSFGDDYYLDFSHRSQLSVWTASYKRDYISARNEVMRPSLFQRQDAFGNLVRDAVLNNPSIPQRNGSPTLNADYYQIERFDTSFTLASGRTALTLQAGHSERIYDIALNDTRDWDGAINLRREISQRTSGFIRLGWKDHKEDALDYDQWLTSLGGNYQIGSASTLGVTLAHLNRNADIDINSYTENRFSIYFSSTF